MSRSWEMDAALTMTKLPQQTRTASALSFQCARSSPNIAEEAMTVSPDHPIVQEANGDDEVRRRWKQEIAGGVKAVERADPHSRITRHKSE